MPRADAQRARVAPFEQPAPLTSSNVKSRRSYSVIATENAGATGKARRLSASALIDDTLPLNINWIGSSTSMSASGAVAIAMKALFFS